MSNEIIFKKCDSRSFLEHKPELNENISLPSTNLSFDDSNEDSLDKQIKESECLNFSILGSFWVNHLQCHFLALLLF